MHRHAAHNFAKPRSDGHRLIAEHEQLSMFVDFRGRPGVGKTARRTAAGNYDGARSSQAPRSCASAKVQGLVSSAAMISFFIRLALEAIWQRLASTEGDDWKGVVAERGEEVGGEVGGFLTNDFTRDR